MLNAGALFIGTYTPPAQGDFNAVYTASTSLSSTIATFNSVNFGAASPSREIICAIAISELHGGVVSATIGGIAATLHVSAADGNGDDEGVRITMFSANVPTGTSGTIVVTTEIAKESTLSLAVWHGRYLRSRVPYDTLGVGDIDPSGTIDVPSHGLLIAASHFLDGGSVTTTGVTENYDQAGSLGQIAGGATEDLAAQTGRTVSFNGANDAACLVAVSWRGGAL